jgi:hypothetical protein
MTSAKYEAAFVVLFDRCKRLYPEVSRQWGTEAVEDWCTVVRDLMRAEGTPKTGTSSVRKGA